MTSLRRIEQEIRPSLRNAVGFGVLALAALIVGHEFSRDNPNLDGYRIAAYACAAGVLVFGVLATRSTAKTVTRVAALRAGSAATSPLRVLIQIVGYLITVIAVLDVLQVNLSQFLVGGALTGVVLGIAAQQSLGNFFAGLVLLFARPYVAGEYVKIFSGTINGPHEGRVADVGLLYTTIRTAAGPLNVPNSVLLASAVGPITPPAPPPPEPPTVPPVPPPALPPETTLAPPPETTPAPPVPPSVP